jgi:hypothetical protein
MISLSSDTRGRFADNPFGPPTWAVVKARFDKYNPNHDPQTGEFSSGGGASLDEPVGGTASPADAVLRWREDGGQVIAYHGTGKDVIDKIMREGITVQRDKNYASAFYRGERGQSVFVARDRAIAEAFARSTKGTQAVVLALRIPKDQWSKFKGDPMQVGEKNPKAAYAQITIPPAWIKGTIAVGGDDAPKDISFKADYVTAYLVIFVEAEPQAEMSQ